MSLGEESSPESFAEIPLEPGTLYVVSTPIGNLEDLTFRALRILKNTDRIFCENAEHSRKLFRSYSISTPASTLYRDQSETPYSGILEELKVGKTFALVSDAGTPGVSDPGSHLIRVVREAGCKITPFRVQAPSLHCSESPVGKPIRFCSSDSYPKRKAKKEINLPNGKNSKDLLCFSNPFIESGILWMR